MQTHSVIQYAPSCLHKAVSRQCRFSSIPSSVRPGLAGGNDTGLAFGLDKSNRFDLDANIAAIIEYFEENEKLARKHHKPDIWVYKYHHDGPSKDYGGEKLTVNKFGPLADKFEKALNVGHSVTIVDPAGAPIADAHVKVTQNGKTAVLKTNEHGTLPSIMASPDFGPITVFIQKADEQFKQLGELAISGLESAWTLVAPKQKFAIKTYVHEPHPGTPAAHAETHKVRRGETISRIARDNGTTYQELAKLNGIEKPWIILPDQVLKLPPKKPVKGAAKPAPSVPVAHPAAAAPAHPAPSAKPAAAPTPAPAKPETPVAAPKAAAAVPAAARPVVTEKRSAETQHPGATVVKAVVTDRIAAAIAFAMAHKKPKSIHYCLRYVKNALVAAGLFAKYPGGEHAKNFGSFLAKEGFDNLLDTKPGTNLDTAPIGSVIVYKPMEKQKFQGSEISGHIEIKCEHGYVSDFLAHTATYGTDTKTLKSTRPNKYNVTFQVIGIWYKE